MRGVSGGLGFQGFNGISHLNMAVQTWVVVVVVVGTVGVGIPQALNTLQPKPNKHPTSTQ